MNTLQKNAENFGCYDLVFCDDLTPNQLDYIDLLKLPEEVSMKVDAVAEFQSRPLLYIVNEQEKSCRDKNHILALQQLLANRGEKAYLGVLSPGQLEIYPINLAKSKIQGVDPVIIDKNSAGAPLFMQCLANGTFSMEGQHDEADFVYTTIYNLMTCSSETLINDYKLNPLDVLSLLGRALFFRFLCDRNIVLPKELSEICPNARNLKDCFSDAEKAISTSLWLDSTFNGDLLPLSDDYDTFFSKYDKLTKGHLFLFLEAILKGWEHVGNGVFQPHLPIDWSDLNFAHIPIGVLSQVYEKFSRIWDEKQSLETSVFYTPKNIARFIVEEAFAGVKDNAAVQILDPSCGAGIFLVLAFRKLYSARWAKEGKRPTTKGIQDILYQQIKGFDISESALRLSALSLYITAIELNDSPRPPKSLKFPKPLQGTVLYNQRQVDEIDNIGFITGSLRNDLPAQFNGAFDIVIGNPPWSRLRGNGSKEHNAYFTELTKNILQKRINDKDFVKEYKNPDFVPDLPFLWRATEWTKENGIIAMALPSRMFLKQTSTGPKAFEAVLRGIEITGILNGSNLSDTAVWPEMNQPFMLFFGKNKIPDPNHKFYFSTPHLEQRLNKEGRLRIDYQAAQPVAVNDILERPWLLKVLAKGTSLDVEIIEKLTRNPDKTVLKYWEKHGLKHGQGYNVSASLKQYDASFLLDRPDFHIPTNNCFLVDVSEFPKFERTTANMPRNKDLYLSPLLIVPQSPGNLPGTPKSYRVNSEKLVAFSQSFYGFSGGMHPEGKLIVAILYLITHSQLFEYYYTLFSSKFGAERRVFLKGDLESFPFLDPDGLNELQKSQILQLSERLEHDIDKPWDEIDQLIFNLYGLDDNDRQVVNDTLEVGIPFKESRDRACTVPVKNEREQFYVYLKDMLLPSFELTNESIEIEEIKLDNNYYECPWYFFAIYSNNTKELSCKNDKEFISLVVKEANRSGCSRVVIHSNECLIIGILGQYRYWTLSRARLCGLHILRHHLDAFPIGRNE